MRTEQKHRLAKLRHWRLRKKICGTKARPRMSVCFSNEHIYVQFIDDETGATLAAASTRCKATKGIQTVVFDRSGARYHWSKGKDGKPVYGKLATLAEAAREAGLKF